MAVFTGGLASGIDSQLIIDQLVKLRSTAITKVQDRQAALTSRISGFGVLASQLAALGKATDGLASGGVRTVKQTGSTRAFSVSVAGGAEAGRYAIAVERLATAAKLRSSGLASADAEITAGTLKLEVRGEAFEVEVKQGQTLADVARAIADSGAPVSAVVISDGTRSYLSITNRETGHPIGGDPDGALQITQTLTGTTGFALFPVDPSVPAGPTIVRAAAQNARLTVDGLSIERTANAIDDVIPGATLTLLQPSEQSAGAALPEDLVLVDNKDGTRARLDTFVNAYNALVQSIRTLNAPADGSVGLLSGDGIARELQSDLEMLLTQTAGNGAVRTLGDVGLELQRDGTLKLDDETFTAALAKNPGAIDRLFADATDGIGKAVGTLVKRYTDKNDGLLTLRQKGVQETIDRLAADVEKQQAHLEKFREALVRQFTALESTISKFNGIANFLKQQEAAREQNK